MEEKSSLASLKKDMLGAAIVKESDMPPDMMSDIQDTVVTCIEGNFTPIFQIDVHTTYTTIECMQGHQGDPRETIWTSVASHYR